MQSGFPVFLGNAIDWLTRDVATIARGLGHVEIPYANAKVTSRDGKPVATLSVAGATMFDAVRPDVFTAVSSAGTTRVVTNVIDAKFSDINRSPFAQERDAVAQTSIAPRFAFEPWVGLLLLAVALLAFEWVTYTRRATI